VIENVYKKVNGTLDDSERQEMARLCFKLVVMFASKLFPRICSVYATE